MLTTEHRQFLYLSRLARAVRYEQFGTICKQARQHNAELRLSGVLLVDGYRFCGLLQGPSESVRHMSEALRADTRHERMKALVDRLHTPPPDPGLPWLSGYCDSEDLDRFEAAAPLGEDELLAAFQAIAARAHLSP